jgi:hypothetical protein
VNLLDRVVERLSSTGIAHALIGAAALAAHGISRSTLDRDLLVTDIRVLDDGFWDALGSPAAVDVRRGDADDPLAGIVRVTSAEERDVDVVVGREAWQREVVARAQRIGAGPLAVVQRADLVLLKLYAGGLQDRWDIEQLLALDRREALVADVDERIEALPRESRELWFQLRRAT